MLSQQLLGESPRLVPIIPVSVLSLSCPLYGGVSAGFPSPADDYAEGQLDLNDYLIQNPSATFFVRVEGESMTGASLCPGDLLVVDRSLEARHEDIVIAVIDNEFTLKRLYLRGKTAQLRPENPNYPTIEIGPDDVIQIWGVVVHVLKQLRP